MRTIRFVSHSSGRLRWAGRWATRRPARSRSYRPMAPGSWWSSFPSPTGSRNGTGTISMNDQRDLVARLVELGARHIDVGQGPDDAHVVLADPDGNELCVIAPGNNFLAGCGRLGAINCDGTKETGYFWSEALAWPLVWDQDEETAIRAPDGTGPLITWSGPPPSSEDREEPAPSRHRSHRTRRSTGGARPSRGARREPGRDRPRRRRPGRPGRPRRQRVLRHAGP